MVLKFIIFILFVAEWVKLVNCENLIDEEVLKNLFHRAAKLPNLKNQISIKKRDVSLKANNLKDGNFEKTMMKSTDKSQEAHRSFMLSLKVHNFLNRNESVLKSSLNMKAPAEFCPFKESLNCDAHIHYRTFDGSCNNLQVPLIGRSNTPYKRYLLPKYQDGKNTPKKFGKNGDPLPNPRSIAMKIHHQKDRPSKISNLGVIFGQFIDHDFAFTSVTKKNNGFPIKCFCKQTNPDCINIMTPDDDKINTDQICMTLARTSGSFQDLNCKMNHREQLNMETHFLDLSQLYGTEDAQAKKLRLFRKGLLKTSRIKGLKGRYLPKAKAGTCSRETSRMKCFESGDSRTSQNLLLVSVHNIWMREHNRLARGLQKLNSHWNDETLFQEARRINIAVYQNIIYQEWLPIIIGAREFSSNNLQVTNFGQYSMTYNQNTNPSIAGEFSGAAFRFGHSLVTSFYSKCDKNLNIFENISLSTIMFRPKEAYVNDGLDALARGLVFDSGSRMDAHLSNVIQNRLFESKGKRETHRLSLSAINIMRGRDHGLPGYNEFRWLAGFQRASFFNDLFDISRKNRNRLRLIYNNVNDIDPFTGGVSEHPIDDALIGPTFSRIVAMQFKDIKDGDRFFFDNGHSRTTRFTIKQLDEIKRMNMAGIMCNNLDLNVIQAKAFLPLSRQNFPADCMKTPVINLKEWKD